MIDGLILQRQEGAVMLYKPHYKRGDKIGGRYLVYQSLMGGMGEVYLCLDSKENRPLALKTFQDRYINNQKLREAFTTEVATWIALDNHPNIVRCYYMDKIDSRPFMFLEWVASQSGRGADLRSWLQRGPLNLRLSLEFTIDICNGLIHAQQKQPGIVHCDLKPENVLIEQEQIGKVTDFGLAKIILAADIDNQGSKPYGHRHLSNMGGTPSYMAPEQWCGQELDERTDIYAIGCILYEMLAGQLPFQAATLDALQHQHLESPIPMLCDSAPLALNALVSRCLTKRKEDRFGDVVELLQELSMIYYKQFSVTRRLTESPDKLSALEFANRGATYDNLQLYDQALFDLTQSIELDQTYAGAYCNRGLVYFNLHRYEEALADYDAAIRLDPALASTYNNRGLVYNRLHKYNEALADYNKAIEIDPLYGAAYANRAMTHSNLKEYNRAVADYDRAIDLEPSNARAYYNRGETYSLLKQYDKALEDVEHSIKLDPYLSSAYVSRGNIYARLERLETALQDYSRAIELNDRDETGYVRRGTVYAMLNRFEDALADLTRAIQVDSYNAEAYSKRGQVYQEFRRYEESLSDCSRAIQLNPFSDDGYLNRAKAYLDLHRYEEAIADLGRAIKIDPGQVYGYAWRGAAYTALERYSEALGDLDRAIEIDPKHLSAHLNRGIVYTALHRYEDALADYNFVVNLNPTDADTYYNRGNLYDKMQRYEEALADYTQAINVDPTMANAYANRGTIYTLLDCDKEALKDFERTIELNPTDSTSYIRLGAFLAGRGEFQAAKLYLKQAVDLGDPMGADLIMQVEQDIQRARGIESDPAQLAFNAFQQANSIKEMRHSVLTFSFMTDPSFIAAIEQVITQQVPAALKPVFNQRLAWLNQIAAEQNIEVAKSCNHVRNTTGQ